MKREDGGPAFPVADMAKTQCSGLSLRDYFAGQALAAVAAFWAKHEPTMNPKFSAEGDRLLIAADCYAIADAMLAERSKP